VRLPKKFVTITTASLLTLGGIGVMVAPMASAVTVAAADADTAGERVQAITGALADLVTGGTITQEQADTVATTLAGSDALRGGGHHGGHLDLAAAATALSMSEDDLRTALEADGATLTTVADAQGVEVSTVSDALTTAATDKIAQRVTDGDITQAQADEKLAELPDRITALLTEEITGHHGHGDADDDADQTTEDQAADSAAGA
jgi:hypothetical protein